MGAYGVLDSEPRHKVDEFVAEIIARRGQVFEALHDELKKVLDGLVDQIALAKKARSSITLKDIHFQKRWVNEGRIVIDVYHRGELLTPAHVKWD